MSKITVVLPTIAGREEHLERCLKAYQENSEIALEMLVLRDLPSCGRAWNLGGSIAEGEYLHFSADDLEPMPGWDHAAIEAIEAGKIPAPLIFKPDGGLESVGGFWVGGGAWALRDWAVTTNTCVVPFIRNADWEANVKPSLDCHYYTDNWFTDQCRRAGMEVVVRHGYNFTHHWAQEGRGDERARMRADKVVYEEASAQWR